MARIVKRTGSRGDISYLIRVSCGYTAAGHQITKSMTWHPEPGMTQRQMQRGAQCAALDFERRVHGGEIPETRGIRMCDFCREYMELKAPQLSPTMRGYYRRVIEDMILPELGHMKLADIRPLHVQHFITSLEERPRRGVKGEHLSAASVHRYFTVLKSVMAAADKLGYIASNPTVSSRLNLPPIDEPEVEVFSERECAAMLSALEEEPLMWQLLINLAVVTGARRGELCALRWENIDTERRSVRICGSSYRLKGGQVQVKSPKTRKSVRTVTFDEYCGQLLLRWRDEQLRLSALPDAPGHDEGWVFTDSTGGPIDPVRPTEWFAQFQKRHGIPYHKFHSLRHTSGTLLLTRGTNIKTVASRLGHTQLSTVNRYVHSLESADMAAAASFDRMRRNAL